MRYCPSNSVRLEHFAHLLKAVIRQVVSTNFPTPYLNLQISIHSHVVARSSRHARAARPSEVANFRGPLFPTQLFVVQPVAFPVLHFKLAPAILDAHPCHLRVTLDREESCTDPCASNSCRCTRSLSGKWKRDQLSIRAYPAEPRSEPISFSTPSRFPRSAGSAANLFPPRRASRIRLS